MCMCVCVRMCEVYRGECLKKIFSVTFQIVKNQKEKCR
jgi:hypothetical protein